MTEPAEPSAGAASAARAASAHGTRPLVVACLRHVDQRPSVDPLTGEVSRDARTAGASMSDLAALEHALRISEAWDGDVLAVVAGPPSVEPTLRAAMSVGARTMRVPWGLDESADAYVTDLAADQTTLAWSISRALTRESLHGLVLCGDRSTDRGTGAFPALLAHHLGAAQATGLVALTVDDGELRGERRLDKGRRELLRIPTNAVVSVEAAGLRLRRAGLRALLDSESAPIDVAPGATPEGLSYAFTATEGRAATPRPRVVAAPTQPDAHSRLVELTGAHTTHDPPQLVNPTDVAAAADSIIDFLTSRSYVGP